MKCIRSKSRIVVIAILVMILSCFMTACGNNENGDQGKGGLGKEKEIGGGEMTLSETLTAKDTVIWYVVDYSDGEQTFGKDSELQRVYVFKGDKVKRFSPNWNMDDPMTIGDVSKMTDKDIVKELEQRQVEVEQMNRKIIKDTLEEGISLYDNEDRKKDLEDMRNDLDAMEENKNDYYPYCLMETTDETGRYTKGEWLFTLFSHSPTLIDKEGGQTSELGQIIGVEDWDVYMHVYALANVEKDYGVEGVIYESHYAGYCDGERNILVRCKEGTVIMTDSPDSKKVVTDPDQQWMNEWAEEHGMTPQKEWEDMVQKMYEDLRYKI